MIEVHQNIYIGTVQDCFSLSPDNWATVHACKHPCHVRALNYTGSLPQSHPNYLVAERDRDLFLNMVDMERELSPVFTNPIMEAAMAFIEKHSSSQRVLIHCNQGMSRAPSIALLHLARIGQIANETFENAATSFKLKYPHYSPARGISLYMTRNWELIMAK
ncbi:MAG: hypothetical protein QOD28_1110 [Acidobacteriota bacterium]|nr:hypothetical protein [Acidobacteriota bacterium]